MSVDVPASSSGQVLIISALISPSFLYLPHGPPPPAFLAPPSPSSPFRPLLPALTPHPQILLIPQVLPLVGAALLTVAGVATLARAVLRHGGVQATSRHLKQQLTMHVKRVPRLCDLISLGLDSRYSQQTRRLRLYPPLPLLPPHPSRRTSASSPRLSRSATSKMSWSFSA